jgi:hypothetical protein
MELALSQPKGMDDRKRKLGSSPQPPGPGQPGWADGLRKLYNSVLDEPLPDSFDDLLKKLDRTNNERK